MQMNGDTSKLYNAKNNNEKVEEKKYKKVDVFSLDTVQLGVVRKSSAGRGIFITQCSQKTYRIEHFVQLELQLQLNTLH